MEDYYYNYDPNLDLSFTNDVYYGNFSAKHPNKPVKQLANRVKDIQPQVEESSGIGMSMMFLLFIVLVLFTVWRYGLLGYALEKNNTVASLALLSPEIGNAVYFLL